MLLLQTTVIPLGNCHAASLVHTIYRDDVNCTAVLDPCVTCKPGSHANSSKLMLIIFFLSLYHYNMIDHQSLYSHV